MQLAQFSADLAATIDRKPGTVLERAKPLRAVGMLSKGKQGPDRGAHLTGTDGVNLMLASILDHRRGDDVAANVTQARDLQLSQAWSVPDNAARKTSKEHVADVADFCSGLGVWKAITFGAALDVMVEDLRSGAFARWTENVPVRLTADYHENHQAMLYLDRPHFNRAAIFAYGSGDDGPTKGISRLIRIDILVLERIAAALGPPPS